MSHSNDLKSKIWSIADQLTAEGVNPTNKAVLNELGSGSYSSISPILKEWRINKHRININEIPIELVRTVKDVWEKISDLSTANFIELSKALEREVIDLTVELEIKNQKCILQSKQIIELQQSSTEMTETIQQSKSRIQAQDSKHAAEIIELNERLTLANDLTVKEKILGTEYKTKLAFTEQSLEEANNQLEVLKESLDEEKKHKYEAVKQTEVKQIELNAAETLAKIQNAQISELSQYKLTLEEELSTKTNEVEKQIVLIADLNDTLLEAQKEIGKINSEMKVSTSKVATLTERVNELTYKNESLTTGSDETRVQYDNLLMVCNSLFDVDVIKQFAINNKAKKDILVALSNQTENKTNR